MDFRLTDEQRQVEEMVRALARKEFAPRAAQVDEESRYPEENHRRLAELGLLGMLYPASFGGSEAGPVAYTIALREVAGGCASTGVGMAVTNMVGETIYRFGGEEQRRKYLPMLSGGKGAGAFALTEPGAGSDAGGLSTFAREDGGHFVLDGSKVFITNGAHACVSIVLALTQKSPRKISAFLVEPGTPGFNVGKGERKMGLKGSDTVSLSFEECRIGKSAMLGSPGEGLKIALSALDGGRIGIASQAIGIARAALSAATEYAKDRRQFGQAIGDFQAIQWKLADAATEIDAAQLLVFRAACLKERTVPYSKEASMAKVFATEAGNRACHAAVQILGGYGYIREYPVERHLRDIRVTTIYEGTSEIQRLVISRALNR
ncbi:MAG TPA: acyl-CoA dehydrogenase [Deltaproteobacteria bacterium]|nr:MAG: acyl-CoA dehydrogenase [Deltaproteobacteria bacterium GWA2_65_63]OGP26807.1 MAG: acyl-CoA dehydrogenase [Deltaproteobacteria bacterium GWB2_65_81]OGP39683.1 MAG: acyl-CoA dehydrogenase [Deltaproteobacteria bacterium GWC2_66_88]OGP77371.1 MAG: acyl-CoA dehydrogenase [Deltaproteobacteria bacterium RBG_16_66_15]HAM32738.1 acyl-CoA dehydrogenase [Deltaproteobacteria bacterium]